jgi:hypothetical protein
VPQKPDRAEKPPPRAGEPRPDVILDVVFEEGLLFVAVSNIGEAPALQVSCTFDGELRGLGGTRDLAQLPLFRNVEFLAPGREIRTLLDASSSYFARGDPTKLSVTIAYRDSAGQPYTATITHDLAIYRDLAYVPKEVPRDA